MPMPTLRAQPNVLFPHNVTCSDFDKINPSAWELRHKPSLDLGNWDGKFVISGPIKAGRFIARGQDLFVVLESECKIAAAL